MNQIAIALIGLFTTIGGSTVAWLISRRRVKAEVSALELQNAQQVVKLWKDLYDELHNKLQEMEKEIARLRSELEGIERTYQKKCDICKYKKAYDNR